MASGLIGQRVGRFRLVQRLGAGSTGAVFLATQVGAAGREVALKVLDWELAAEPGFGDRLEREIRAVSTLSHPHILPVYEYGTAGELTYLAMPVARGGSLRAKLRRGRLGPTAAWDIIVPVAHALHSAHGIGVVHRDVKPGNILFDDYGRVLLSDFGVARTHLGFALGTPGYMAPEHVAGRKADRRADVYGLAVVAFEILTGTPPYRAHTAAELLRATVDLPVPAARDRSPELPPGLDGALYRGLTKSPEHRYQTVLELLWALGQVLDPATSRAGRPRRGPRRERELGTMPTRVFVPSVLEGGAGRRRGLVGVEPGA